MNKCEKCKDFAERGETKNHVKFGQCERELGFFNTDDLEVGGFAVINIRPTALVVSAEYGCVNFRKKEEVEK